MTIDSLHQLPTYPARERMLCCVMSSLFRHMSHLIMYHHRKSRTPEITKATKPIPSHSIHPSTLPLAKQPGYADPPPR
jgi:hypothetical protein